MYLVDDNQSFKCNMCILLINHDLGDFAVLSSKNSEIMLLLIIVINVGSGT